MQHVAVLPIILLVLLSCAIAQASAHVSSSTCPGGSIPGILRLEFSVDQERVRFRLNNGTLTSDNPPHRLPLGIRIVGLRRQILNQPQASKQQKNHLMHLFDCSTNKHMLAIRSARNITTPDDRCATTLKTTLAVNNQGGTMILSFPDSVVGINNMEFRRKEGAETIHREIKLLGRRRGSKQWQRTKLPRNATKKLFNADFWAGIDRMHVNLFEPAALMTMDLSTCFSIPRTTECPRGRVRSKDYSRCVKERKSDKAWKLVGRPFVNSSGFVSENGILVTHENAAYGVRRPMKFFRRRGNGWGPLPERQFNSSVGPSMLSHDATVLVFGQQFRIAGSSSGGITWNEISKFDEQNGRWVDVDSGLGSPTVNHMSSDGSVIAGTRLDNGDYSKPSETLLDLFGLDTKVNTIRNVGTAAAMTSDGSILLVRSRRDSYNDDDFSRTHTLYSIEKQPNGTFGLQDANAPPLAMPPGFIAMALSQNGNRVIARVHGGERFVVSVFNLNKTAGEWSRSADLNLSILRTSSLTVSADALTVAVRPRIDGVYEDRVRVYRWKPQSNQWVQLGNDILLPGDKFAARSFSLRLSTNGDTLSIVRYSYAARSICTPRFDSQCPQISALGPPSTSVYHLTK